MTTAGVVVDFRLLGPLEVVNSGHTVPLGGMRLPAVLAALLLNANQTVTVEYLASLVWPAPPRAVESNVRTYIAQLRGVLSAADESGCRVVTGTGGYRLEIMPGELDLATFDGLVRDGEQALSLGQVDLALDQLRRALDLWRGEPLAGVTGAAALGIEVARLEERRLQVAERWAGVALRAGRPDEAAAELARLVRVHPLREQLWAQLMLALYRGGQQAAALAAYRHAYRLLDEELGIPPGKPLQQLHRQILTADPALDPPPANAAPPANAGPPANAAPATADPAARMPGAGEPRVQSLPPTHPALPAQASRPANGAVPPAARTPAGYRAALSRVDSPVDPPPRQLPADVPTFAGRAEQLRTLDSLLDGRDAAGSPALVIAAITGTAGVGKTTLAVHWAHRVADRFPDGQLYLDLSGFHPASTVVGPADAVRGLLDAFGVPSDRTPASLPAQIARYRSVLADKRVLIVLDDARGAEQVRPLLPGSPGCLVVVTSRTQLSSLVAAEAAHPLTLDLMSAAEAGELLSRRLGADRVAAEPEAVAEVIARCARLPLALSIVAARAAAHPGFPLATIAAELTNGRGGLDGFGYPDTATDVRPVFSRSYLALGSSAAGLFRLLTLHPGPDIAAPAAAALSGLTLPRVGALLAELSHTHLVSEHVPGRFTLHGPLRAYGAELSQEYDGEAGRRAALRRALDYYLHSALAAALTLDPKADPPPLPRPDPAANPERFRDAGRAMSWFVDEYAVLLAAVNLAAGTGFDAHAWRLADATTHLACAADLFAGRSGVGQVAAGESATPLF